MTVETTLYINKDLLSKIDDAGKILKTTRSELVSILLVRYMKSNQCGGKVFWKLRYQRRGAEFVTKSLCLRKDIYEMWCDVRKVFKLSASLCISLAIIMYLNDILKGKKATFNYLGMYATNTIYKGDACIIQIIWGVLGEKKLQKLLEI